MISVVIPVYNEEAKLEKNIQYLTCYLNKINLDYEIILSNDGSTDDSLEIIEKISRKNPKIILVNGKKNRGRGHAIKESIGHIQGKKVLFMDVDMPLDTNLDIIPKIMNRLNKYDILIGSRFHELALIKRKSGRKVLSKVYRTLVGLLFPSLNVKDPDVGFKAFKKEVFIKINEQVKSGRWSWDLEFLLIAKNKGYSIKELPLEWVERGNSNINLFSTSLEQLFSLIYFKIKYC